MQIYKVTNWTNISAFKSDKNISKKPKRIYTYDNMKKVIVYIKKQTNMKKIDNIE